MDFRIDLDIFRGPMDLLLYLVRKHEVEVVDISVAKITDQYLEHLAVLERLDVNAVGDFVDVASTLIELKSRMVLPNAGEEVDEDIDRAHEDLVRRLLQYKQFRDAASILEERGRLWQDRYPRTANDLPPRRPDIAEQPIREVELWDLVSAFGRIVRDSATAGPSSIVYDDTPIHVFMTRIHEGVGRHQRLAFSELFEAGMHKSTRIGVFLALLELARDHHVRAEQNDLFGEIWILPGSNFGEPLDLSRVQNYEHDSSAQ